MIEQNSLNRDDLFLLMKTYENSVSLNTTLLEQQKHVLEKQNQLLTKQQDLFHSITKLIEKIESHNDISHNDNTRLENINKEIIHSIEEMNKTITDFKETCIGNYNNIEKLSTEINSKSSEEHKSIKFKIWYLYAGLLTFVVSVFTMLMSFINKISLIESIAKHLGIIQ